MNSPNNQNWKQRLQELEVEIAKETAKPLEKLRNHNSFESNQVKTKILPQLQSWFANLPKVAKIIVAVAALMIGFSVLNTIFKLISAVISLAILTVVLYLVYQFFIADDPSA